MSDVIQRAREVEAHRCYDWDCDQCGKREALAVNVLPALLDVLEHLESATEYADNEDSVGGRVCCGVRSYKDHRDTCCVRIALAALEKELPKRKDNND